MVRPFVILGALGLVALLFSVTVGTRLYWGDPVRSPYCKVLPCPDLDGYEALCRVASIVDLIEFDSVDERIAVLKEELDQETAGPRARANLEKVLPLPTAERFGALRAAARDSGAPEWRCPPLDRVLTSTGT